MNVLKREKQEQAIAMLAEGSSIRSVERVTGIHRDTIMRLMVRIGNGCRNLMHERMRNLSCEDVQVDECWTFVGKKQHMLKEGESGDNAGDFWVWVALDADTKLVPVHRVGKRTKDDAVYFMRDLARRVSGRIQISSDGLAAYVDAVEQGFGGQVDYGQCVKSFEGEFLQPGRYGPPGVSSMKRRRVVGSPEWSRISTSFVEKQNHTLRSHVRRMTRLTNAFSKKAENLVAAVGLHFAYYNFVKMHRTLRMTPALKAGVTRKLWSLADLIEEAEAHS